MGQTITAMRKKEKIDNTFFSNKKISTVDTAIFKSPETNKGRNKTNFSTVAGAFSFSFNVFSYAELLSKEGIVL
ncbi:MAG TPA: hypothetical protein VFE53_02220 [Mucilaginibacter sp.]|jgi:hypothetical protein|nr:hypothetical protein [Mucilaginibacter sp.]